MSFCAPFTVRFFFLFILQKNDELRCNMAERKNFLDREYEKENDENILPYSIALIPGLTALEQDALINDIAGTIVQDINNSSSSVKEHIDDRKLADRLERYIHRMPEPLQDSWLMSVNSKKGKPKLLNEKEKESGFYSPEDRTVYVKKSLFQNNPYVAIHEYAHKTNHDLNVEHPYYVNMAPEEIPDRMVGINLGHKILEDFPSSIEGRNLDSFNSRTVGNVFDAVSKAGYLKPIPIEKLGDKNAREHSFNVQKLSNDIFNLRPGSVTTQQDMLGTGGHDLNYRDKQYLDNKKLAEKLLDKGKTRDFTTPDGLRLGIEYGEMKDIARNAALSAEGAAETAEVLATEGGKDYVVSRFPGTYETMMEEYRNDPRRSLPKEQIRPWQMYSHDSKGNVYKVRGETVKYNPNAELHYVRVPNAYGGYVYPDDYDKGTYAALKRGRNFIEYRGLDGKWYRVKPEEIKGASAKMRTVDQLARSVGKNLPKMIKRVK